jgi:hypothetical protein
MSASGWSTEGRVPSTLSFAPSGLDAVLPSYPQLALWATFFHRFAANLLCWNGLREKLASSYTKCPEILVKREETTKRRAGR